MNKVITLPIADLVEDLEVYPRHAVDDQHVRNLALALEAGCDLPPVVADAKSKRIADGWHRVRARKRVHGPGAAIEVELRAYASEAALVEDAVRLNSAHGRKLDVMDLTRAILMLERHGVPMGRIALAVHVPEGRVEKLRLKVARATVTVDGTVPGSQTVVLKRPVAHLSGRKLTNEQARAMDSMPGTSFLLLAHQLRTAMATALVNREDMRLMDGLRELKKELEKFLAA
jgi:hypothetical protein